MKSNQFIELLSGYMADQHINKQEKQDLKNWLGTLKPNWLRQCVEDHPSLGECTMDQEIQDRRLLIFTHCPAYTKPNLGLDLQRELKAAAIWSGLQPRLSFS